MLSDMRLASKTEAKRKAEEERRLDLVETTDRRVDLTKANRCNKTAYLNHGGLCWASRETGKHYALLSSEDGVLLRDPPPRLIASWRRIGPPLQYNPNNRRKRPSSTSPGDERKERQKPIREMKDDTEFERVQYQMQQARDRQMDYEDRRAQQQHMRMMESQRSLTSPPGWVYGQQLPAHFGVPFGAPYSALAAPVAAAQSTASSAVRVSTPPRKSIKGVPSSPVNSEGREDT